MTWVEFLCGSGHITHSKVIYFRQTKEALQKHYKVVVVEESPNHLVCKLVRHVRLYGAPIIFVPQATLDLILDHENDISTLHYSFRWPEYYLVLLSATLFGLFSARLASESSVIERFQHSVTSFLLALVFCSFLVFLDTTYVSYRIRKILIRL